MQVDIVMPDDPSQPMPQPFWLIVHSEIVMPDEYSQPMLTLFWLIIHLEIVIFDEYQQKMPQLSLHIIEFSICMFSEYAISNPISTYDELTSMMIMCDEFTMMISPASEGIVYGPTVFTM